jgi:hypothetical protein
MIPIDRRTERGKMLGRPTYLLFRKGIKVMAPKMLCYKEEVFFVKEPGDDLGDWLTRL